MKRVKPRREDVRGDDLNLEEASKARSLRYERINELIGEALNKPIEQRDEALADLVQFAKSLPDKRDRRLALLSIASTLPAIYALDAIREMGVHHRANHLVDLAERLIAGGRFNRLAAAPVRSMQEQHTIAATPEVVEVISAAVEEIRRIPQPLLNSSLLQRLSVFLPPRQALAAIKRGIREADGRASAVQELIDRLNEEERADVLPELVALAKEIQDEGGGGRLLEVLSRHLPSMAAVLALKAIGNEWERINAMVDQVPHILAEHRIELVVAAKEISDEWRCGDFLVRLAPHLTRGQVDLEIEIAETFKDEAILRSRRSNSLRRN